MKRYLYVILWILLLTSTTGAVVKRAGWSYSGTVTFTLKEPVTLKVYHDPEKAFPYEGKPEETPIFSRPVEAGKYLLTLEGYYYMETE